MFTNPFNYYAPAKEKNFLGRSKVVAEIIDNLYTHDGSSYGIIGGKRFGKSSLLAEIAHQLSIKINELNTHPQEISNHRVYVLPVSISLHEIGQTTSLETIYRLFIHRIRQATSGVTKPYSLFRGSVLDLELTKDTQIEVPIVNLFTFERIVDEIITTAYQKLHIELRLVLLIDEVDTILDVTWRDNFFQNIRSLIDNNHRHRFIRFILASSGQYLTNKGSPLLNVLQFHYLESFDIHTVHTLINRANQILAKNVSDIVAAEIVQYGGGHPFILQYILQNLVRDKSKFDSCADVAIEILRFIRERSKDLESWWGAIDQDGQELYYILAKKKTWMEDSELQAMVNIPNFHITNALTILCYHGFVIHDGTFQKYRTSGQLFQDWATNLYENLKQNSTPVIPTIGGRLRLSTQKQEKRTKSAQEAPISVESYVNFDLHIASNGHTIANSPQGNAVADISTEMPSNIRLALNLINRRSADAALLKEVGIELYKWLFPAPIHTHLHQTEAAAKSKNAKVRLRVRIESNIIASLPLEFLYREIGGYFLALNPITVFSRYLHLPLPPERIRQREGTLHMLTVIADPIDQTRLNPDEWEDIIQKALTDPVASGQITIQTVKNATRKDIRNALLKQKPDIIQFVGHGIYQNGKGYVALVDGDTNKTWLVDDERFANLFMGYDDHLGLVCLATCESAQSSDPQSFLGIAPQLVQRLGVPAVIAMQYEVYIKTAKVFLEDLYSNVAARKPIDWAAQSARNAISLEFGLDNREFATPVLYMRAHDGNLF